MAERVLVTGANGFVGRFVSDRLARNGLTVRRAARNIPPQKVPGEEWGRLSDLRQPNCLEGLVRDCGVVVHLAAKVHAFGDEANSVAGFNEVNLSGTMALAEAAVKAGVRRFVFASTVGVHATPAVGPLTEESPIFAQNAYTGSKRAAECALQKLSAAAGMELAILRPPLVYGPYCPGNIGRLARLVRSGLPMPFGSIRNQRSLIGVDNLAEAVLLAATHRNAANQTFLLSDGEDASTMQLVDHLAIGLECPARIFPFPQLLLKCAGWVLGRQAEFEKFTDSLQIDGTKIREMLGFEAVKPLAVGLIETGRSFRIV